MIVGKRLAELRKDKKLRQKDLAELVGVYFHTISTYERELRAPPIDMIIKFTKIFGVTSDYLLGLTDIRSYNAAIASAIGEVIATTIGKAIADVDSEIKQALKLCVEKVLSEYKNTSQRDN